MKYAVIKVSNGNYQIASEWESINEAIVNYHTICTTLWNASDVKTGCVGIVNENLQICKVEIIDHKD